MERGNPMRHPSRREDTQLFEHELFDKYSFDSIPLDRDCYLMDEIYLPEYEKSLLEFFAGRGYDHVGYVAYVAARRVTPSSAELSWYPNAITRFHELTVSLPKEQFVACVGSWRCDEKPHIFVRSAWMNQLHLRDYSMFALIDVIGVKKALQDHSLTRERLVQLRTAIDELATRHGTVAFISFADSLLLKSNWSVRHRHGAVAYTYEPEVLLAIIEELQSVYRKVLGLNVYAVLTQGANEYYEDAVLHIFQNHVCLNSLGIPFAELIAIEAAARESVKAGVHEPSELYMDEKFFRSLRLQLDLEKDAIEKNRYRARMMSTDGAYYHCQCRMILDNLAQIEAP
jgi:hypothetical protein